MSETCTFRRVWGQLLLELLLLVKPHIVIYYYFHYLFYEVFTVLITGTKMNDPKVCRLTLQVEILEAKYIKLKYY